MKILITSLLLLITLNAQNVWYVNRDTPAGNNGNGRSWATAWRTLDSCVWLGYNGVNWAIIGDGDTIYVSGGTDSTTYYPIANNYYNGIRRESFEVQRTFNQTVIIAPAWHSGHNGDVYFVHKNDATYTIFVISGVDNVKITGMKFVDRRVNPTQNNGMMAMYGKDNIVENCYYYSKGLTTGLYMEGERLIFRNNYYDSEANNLPNDIDVIGASGGPGFYIIEGNILITRNSSPNTTSHRDMLQFGGIVGSRPNTTMIIRNNLIIDKGNSISWNGLIYSSGTYTDTTKWFIYNNVLVSTTTSSSIGGIFLYQYNEPGRDWSENFWIFNNTMIINDPGSGLSRPITSGNAPNTDTLFVKNNLIITDAPVNIMIAVPEFYFGEYYRQYDYNGYFEYGGISNPFMNGNGFGAFSFAQWQAHGGDINSITGNSTSVTFANKYGVAFEDYYTETGRGLGENLAVAYPWLYARFPDMIYDALGNLRPQTGAWDMGALQFQGSPQNNINVRGKVFLQGPFLTNSMSTSLNQGGYLPNSQPYNQPPWNYNGSESFSSGPSSNMVDWVLVELRNASNPSQVVSRRAAIVKNDGLLLRPNGNEGVFFDNVNAGQYYISIYHRNHLAIMSSSPVQLSANSSLYDFTTAMNKAYGQNPMVELSPGKFGMIAADGNADGIINSYDRDGVWLIQNGTMGYKGGDFNMNSGVTVHDVNQLWNVNNGRVSQVP